MKSLCAYGFTSLAAALVLSGCGGNSSGDGSPPPPPDSVPSVAITTPVGTQSGLVAIAYVLTDAQSDLCTLAVAFSTDGGFAFATATDGVGGDLRANLASSPGGTAHVYVWNSYADGVAPAGPNSTVRIRITPSDGGTGLAVSTPSFTVNNLGCAPGQMISGAFPLQSNPSPTDDAVNAVAVDSQFMYLAARDGAPGNGQWRLEKRNLHDGTLVAAFGTGGVIGVNPGAGEDQPLALLIQGTWMYVIGCEESAPLGTHNYDWRLEKRRLSDGDPDPAFGTGGVITIDLEGDALIEEGVLQLASDGTNLYVSGVPHVPGGADGDCMLRLEKRLLTDGSPVTAFGTNGVVTLDVDTGTNGAVSMCIDATSMYLAGATGAIGTFDVRFEKRNLSDGALDSFFGTNGVVSESLSPGNDVPYGMAIDGTSLYAFVHDGTPGAGQAAWRFEKRALSDGALTAVTTGAGLTEQGKPGGGVVISGNAMYVTGRDSAGDTSWRTEKRLISDLSLVASFGTGGVAASNASGGSDEPYHHAIAGDVLYVVGADSGPVTNLQLRIEARWK